MLSANAVDAIPVNVIIATKIVKQNLASRFMVPSLVYEKWGLNNGGHYSVKFHLDQCVY